MAPFCETRNRNSKRQPNPNGFDDYQENPEVQRPALGAPTKFVYYPSHAGKYSAEAPSRGSRSLSDKDAGG